MVLSGAGNTRGLAVVTGADGFVGRAACGHLRARGVPLRGLVRKHSPMSAARPDRLPVGDLSTISDSALANALHGAQSVVHLAGRAHVLRESEADPLTAFRAINVVATERLARVAAALGVAHFVFASSVKVNGETTLPGRTLRENDPPDPHDDYAASKWEAECALADVARDTGMPVTVLRLPLMYGPGVKGNFARLADAVARGMPLPFASIDNRRSLLGASNFAGALDVVLTHAAPNAGTVATWFVADAEPVSTPQLVREIATALAVAPRLVPIPPSLLHFFAACLGRAPAADRLTESLVVETGAFRGAYVWQPPRTMAEELADMARARHTTVASPL